MACEFEEDLETATPRRDATQINRFSFSINDLTSATDSLDSLATDFQHGNPSRWSCSTSRSNTLSTGQTPPHSSDPTMGRTFDGRIDQQQQSKQQRRIGSKSKTFASKKRCVETIDGGDGGNTNNTRQSFP